MPDDIEQMVARLLALRDEWGEEAARAALERQAVALPEANRARLRALVFGVSAAASPAGISVSGDAEVVQQVHGPVGQLIGKLVLGRDAAEEERQHLAYYLEGLIGQVAHIALRGIDARLDAVGEGISLERAYVMLATESLASFGSYPLPHGPSPYFEDDDPRRPLRPAHDPAHALPHQAILRVSSYLEEFAAPTLGVLQRAQLATEAALHPRLLLLGEPGGGKSTFLRALALALAWRGLRPDDPRARLFGWDERTAPLPVLISLRALAARLAAPDARERAVADALRAEVERHAPGSGDALLRSALKAGVLLLCDGLDEVPAEARAGVSADRAATLRALRAFADGRPGVRLIITCRTRAFDDRLREAAGSTWQRETLAPFTLGQIRHFVSSWYREGVQAGHLSADQAELLGARLIDTITSSPRLKAMAGTPLLLTMMALVLFNQGELPRDRPRLYERILHLLLGQWDQVRAGQGLAEAVGLPDWGSERFRPLLDQLSYQAHRAGGSGDGRGHLSRGDLYSALISFFQAAQTPAPGDAALRWLEYVDQRSGLLAPDGPDGYVFAHLSLQEHCAGRHIALNSENPVSLVMQHREDDRWREPIFLGAGLMRPIELNALLSELIDREGKLAVRWYRDLILAAELGKDRDWAYQRTQIMMKVDRLQGELKRGLVALLADRQQPLPVAERVRAGFLLGDLGDLRFPVTVEQWRREIDRAREGSAADHVRALTAGDVPGGLRDTWPESPYFCPVASPDGGTPIFVARYPITNAQLREWPGATQRPEWRRAHDEGFNRPNQPAAGVSWFLASEFCAWLSQQLGVTIRLPREAEWEAAAYGGDGRPYPWGSTRRRDLAAIKDDQNLRGWPFTVPVGCYPAGASAVGALDMAGNVWEWTDDTIAPGSEQANTRSEAPPRVMRGGCYRSKKSHTMATARIGQAPGVAVDDGLRVVFDPRGAVRAE